jgi:Coenzyme PQQ synthesis protein D (PqqD)
MIVFTDRVEVPSYVMVRFLDNESVFLNLDTERYFGLDQTGTRMWQVITGSSNIEAAFQQLLSEFEVDPDTLRNDLLSLLEKLVENNLLQMVRVDVGTPSTI